MNKRKNKNIGANNFIAEVKRILESHGIKSLDELDERLSRKPSKCKVDGKINLIRADYERGVMSIKEIAEKYGISKSQVQRYRLALNWKSRNKINGQGNNKPEPRVPNTSIAWNKEEIKGILKEMEE